MNDTPPTPPRAVPLEGAISVRVRYCECDPMGVAHHSVFPIWLEIARTELLRRAGVSYKEMEAAGFFLVVAKLEINYRRPARYDDELTVHCRVTGGSAVKLTHAYSITRAAAPGQPEETIAVGASTLASVNREGRVQPMPEWLCADSRAPDQVAGG